MVLSCIQKYSKPTKLPCTCIYSISCCNHFHGNPLFTSYLLLTRGRYVVSKLLKGRGLRLQVSCKPFPMVYSQLRWGEMTYNYYLLGVTFQLQVLAFICLSTCQCAAVAATKQTFLRDNSSKESTTECGGIQLFDHMSVCSVQLWRPPNKHS